MAQSSSGHSIMPWFVDLDPILRVSNLNMEPRCLSEGEDKQHDDEHGDRSSAQEDAEETGVVTTVAFEANVYGAMLGSIIVDLPHVLEPEDHHLHGNAFSFALVLYILNVVMQAMLIYYVNLYLVGPSVRICQTLLMQFFMVYYDENGNKIPGAVEDFQQMGQLCDIAMFDIPFHALILFCWTITALVEVRASEKLLRVIWALPQCGHASEMVAFKGSLIHILGVTNMTRLLLAFGVAIPKLFVSAIVMWLGSQFLAATKSMTELVLNAIAICFVATLDELLYQAVLPASHQKRLAAIVIERQPGTHANGYAYARSAAYLIGSFAYVGIFYGFLQSVLPPPWLLVDVVSECASVNLAKSWPLCRADALSWWWNSEDSNRDCYPYGRTIA